MLLYAVHCPCCMSSELMCRAVAITIELKKRDGFGPKLKDFKSALDGEPPQEIKDLRRDVEKFAQQFPTIGFDKGEMRYQD